MQLNKLKIESEKEQSYCLLGCNGLVESELCKMHEFNCSVCVADMKNERMKLITKELGKELELKVECNFTQEANIESAV